MMLKNYWISFLFITCLLASCVTTRSVMSSLEVREAASLSSRISTFFWDETTKQKQKAKGTMRWVKKECIQLSFRTPIVPSEALRVVFTPNKIQLFNRLEKEYIELTYDKLKRKFPALLSFSELEEALYMAIQPKGKGQLKGTQLGLSFFTDYDLFIDKVNLEAVELYSTKIPKSYKWIDEDDFINQLSHE